MTHERPGIDWKMVALAATEPTSLFFNNRSTGHLHRNKSCRRHKNATTLAKNKDLHENGTIRQQPNSTKRAPSAILAQSAVAVFGLGFIDAGYSGDWSRIGVISKESEDLLKIAAFLVIPVCIYLIISISKGEQE